MGPPRLAGLPHGDSAKPIISKVPVRQSPNCNAVGNQLSASLVAGLHLDLALLSRIRVIGVKAASFLVGTANHGTFRSTRRWKMVAAVVKLGPFRFVWGIRCLVRSDLDRLVKQNVPSDKNLVIVCLTPYSCFPRLRQFRLTRKRPTHLTDHVDAKSASRG